MKLPKHLYSRLALVTCFTLVVGYFVAYAAYQIILPTEYAPGQSLSSTLMGKIVGNIDSLNSKFGTLSSGKWCTSDGNKIDCSTTAPVGSTGSQGPAGIQGPIGPQGPIGAAGASGIGAGQTWQDLTASRGNDTVYTNDTGKPIFISVSTLNSNTVSAQWGYVDSILVEIVGSMSDRRSSIQMIVPAGSSYHVGWNGTNSLVSWAELR